MKKLLLLSLFCFSISLLQAQNNVEALFNGKDLSNWNFVVDGDKVPAEQVYSIKDGVINIKGEPFGYMYTKKKYGNCHLHLEWRWVKEATNSGIFLLMEEIKNPFPKGIECQLYANHAGDLVMLEGADLKEYQLPADGVRPRFPVLDKHNESSEKPVEEWNCADIYIYNGVITVYINGIYQNSATNPMKEGYIGLQSEGKEIQFRNVRVAEMK